MVLVKPLEVLNRLIVLGEQILRHIHFHRMPNLQNCGAILRSLDRAYLVITSWNPFDFHSTVNKFDMEEVLPIVLDSHIVAVNVA